MAKFATNLILWFVFLGTALAGDFDYVSFDIPGARSTRPFGVNARGQVVGLYRDAANVGHGFVIDPTQPSESLRNIDVPGATFTNAGGINSRGDVVGRWTDGLGINRAYELSKNAGFTHLQLPAGCVESREQTVAHGINDVGDVVGRCFDSTGTEHGFLIRADETSALIDYPGAVTSDAWMITNSGDIVGDYSDGSGAVHGFLRTAAGQYVSTFDYPGVTITSARWINERGDITGVYETADGNNHGFLFRNGIYITIEIPGATTQLGSLAINNSGLIAGDYVDASGEHGFLAIPTQ